MEDSIISTEKLSAGLRKLRRRRWFLWLLILAYAPLMMVALATAGSQRVIMIAFGFWILLVILAVALMTLARCPRCGHCFHMSGYLFRPVRRCFECGLHLTADKQAKKLRAIGGQTDRKN